MPPWDAALRTVNSGGAVVRGPTPLYGKAAQDIGIMIESCVVTYDREVLGPWLFADWHEAEFFLGYRPQIALEFVSLQSDDEGITNFGFSRIMAHYLDADASDEYAALQFTLFQASGVWRGVRPPSWAPRPAGKKQTPSGGYSLSLQLTARDLIDAPGDWSNSTW